MSTVIRGILPLAAVFALAACAGGPEPVPDPDRAAAANAELGVRYLRDGNEAEAVKRLEKALEYDSRHVDAHWALGIAYDRLNEPEAADRHYRRAIDIQDRPEILNSYGVFLCRRERVEDALDYFERAVDDPGYPGPADALANAGLCLDRVGQPDRAERYFRRALARNERHRPSLAGLAEQRLEEGDALHARGFFQRLQAASGPDRPLTDDWLLLGARIETVLGDREAAAAYLQRYNERNPGDQRTLDDLESGS